MSRSCTSVRWKLCTSDHPLIWHWGFPVVVAVFMCFVLFTATTTSCRRCHRYQRRTSQTVFDVFPLIIIVVAFRKHYAPQFAALWNVVGEGFIRSVLQSQSQSLRSLHELNPQFILCGSRLRCSRMFVWRGSYRSTRTRLRVLMILCRV